MFSKKTLIVGASLVLMLAQAMVSFAQEAGGGNTPPVHQAEEQTVTISGRAIDSVTGAPLPGALVSTMEVSVTADAEGRFTIPGVPQTRDAMLNFRVVTEKGGSVLGCAFIAVPVSLMPISAHLGDRFAVTVVETKGDVDGVEIRAADVAGEGLEKTCSVCHLPNPCLAKATGTEAWNVEETHLGGVEVTQEEFDETKARILAEGVKPDTYPNLRFQDAHRHRMNIAQAVEAKPDMFKMPETLLLTDNVVNCDTCHTRHQPTEFSLFLRLDIATRSALCRQCHK